jgi:hypothetical protein
MFPFRSEKKQPTTDLYTVESQRNDLIPEEFPEGPYGSTMLVESLGKSTPWRDDQRPPNRFSYENRELHAGLERDYPGDHELHDLSGSDRSELE